MTKQEFYVLNHAYDCSVGREEITIDVNLNEAIQNATVMDGLKQDGLIDEYTGVITQRGKDALEPYRVNNAVILAAGAATRFIPLSLEQPKGLYEVKGEALIERQIKQLQQAGITDITIVLGYKKEMFFYLREKYDVKFIFNASYNVKNNVESIYLAKKQLNRTYICSCDDYFTENPFLQFEYQSFYAGLNIDKKTTEMYVEVDGNNQIVRMQQGMNAGKIVLGHSFWDKEFSDKFIAIAEEDKEVGVYDTQFWEWIVMDYVKELPAFYWKQFTAGSIHEFDFFEELREFDEEYNKDAHSKIIENIKSVFHCNDEDIVDFRNVNEGMTNISFIFKIDEVDYIYRHPGDGTENIISRKNERTSLEKAREIEIDPTYIYLNIEEGWKISKFVKKFREPEYDSFEDSKKVIAVLQRLHASSVKVEYGLKPWEDALKMEEMLRMKDPTSFNKFEDLKEDIYELYQMVADDGVQKCFCHGDTYKPNWMIKDDGEVILIDWEYSGYSDPGIDVGYYIVDAMYDFGDAEAFITEYLGDDQIGRAHV